MWNVLRGEMSLVGPRPEHPDIIAEWPNDIREILLSVRPGITSPASVIYRDEESRLEPANLMDGYLRSILPSKLRLDCLYVQDRTLLNDLDVLFWTSTVLVPQLRVQHVPEHRLYWGPLSLFVNHYFSWFLVDLVIALGTVALTGLLWRAAGPLHIGRGWSVLLAVGIALLFSVFNSLLGLNRVFWSKARPTEVIDLALSSGLVTAILLLLNAFVLPFTIPLGMVVMIAMLNFLGFTVARYRARIFTGLATRWISLRGGVNILGEKVLIVGAGEMGQFVAWLIRRGGLSKAFSIVGMVDDDPRLQGMRIDGYKVLGLTQQLPEIVQRFKIGVLIFAISNIDASEKNRIYDLCQESGVRVVLIPDVMKSLWANFFVDWSPHLNGDLQPEPSENGNGDHADHAPWIALHRDLEELEALISAGEQDESLLKITDLRSRILEKVSAEHLQQ